MRNCSFAFRKSATQSSAAKAREEEKRNEKARIERRIGYLRSIRSYVYLRVPDQRVSSFLSFNFSFRKPKKRGGRSRPEKPRERGLERDLERDPEEPRVVPREIGRA